jgi:hypothetical protein
MSKHVPFRAILAFALVASLFINLYLVKGDSNEPLMFSSGLTIYSPLNTTYDTNILKLNLTFGCGAGLNCSLNYNIDGEYQGPISLTFNNTAGFQMFYLGYAVVQLPKLSNGYHVLSVDVEAYLNDFHGANPPGAPFRLVAPESSDYVASWINSVYFTIASSDVVTTSTPSVTATPTVTVSPTIPEFPSTIQMIAFLITATSLGTVVIKRKRYNRS